MLFETYPLRRSGFLLSRNKILRNRSVYVRCFTLFLLFIRRTRMRLAAKTNFYNRTNNARCDNRVAILHNICCVLPACIIHLDRSAKCAVRQHDCKNCKDKRSRNAMPPRRRAPRPHHHDERRQQRQHRRHHACQRRLRQNKPRLRHDWRQTARPRIRKQCTCRER